MTINCKNNICENIKNININLEKRENLDVINNIYTTFEKILENIINNIDIVNFKIICKNIIKNIVSANVFDIAIDVENIINICDFNIVIEKKTNIKVNIKTSN